MHALDRGKGEPPIVFLHGMLGSARYWDTVIEYLGIHPRTIALDLLGFGESPKPRDNKYDVDSQILCVNETLKTLGANGPYTLVGHSMGAIIALRIAVDHPEKINKLILFGMPIFKDKESARRVIVDSGIVPKFMYYGPVAQFICSSMCLFRPLTKKLVPMFRKGLPKNVLEDSVKHTWYSYSRSMNNIIENQDILKDLNSLTIPTTLVYGASDEIVKLHDVADLANDRSNINVKVFEGTHHYPIEHPETAASTIV